MRIKWNEDDNLSIFHNVMRILGNWDTYHAATHNHIHPHKHNCKNTFVLSKETSFLSKHVQFLLLSIFGFAFWWWQNKLLFLLWPAPARHRLGIRISNTQPNHVHLAVATSNPIHPRTITCTPRLIIFQLNSGNQYLLPWYYFHFISFT